MTDHDHHHKDDGTWDALARRLAERGARTTPGRGDVHTARRLLAAHGQPVEHRTAELLEDPDGVPLGVTVTTTTAVLATSAALLGLADPAPAVDRQAERRHRPAPKADDQPLVRTATGDAGRWLADYLVGRGGAEERALTIRAGLAAGHSLAALNRARVKLGVQVNQVPGAFPRRTRWALPGGAGAAGQ